MLRCNPYAALVAERIAELREQEREAYVVIEQSRAAEREARKRLDAALEELTAFGESTDAPL